MEFKDFLEFLKWAAIIGVALGGAGGAAVVAIRQHRWSRKLVQQVLPPEVVAEETRQPLPASAAPSLYEMVERAVTMVVTLQRRFDLMEERVDRRANGVDGRLAVQDQRAVRVERAVSEAHEERHEILESVREIRDTMERRGKPREGPS